MFQEDLSVFFADFGENVAYGQFTYTGIFDRAALEVVADASLSYDSTQPLILMQTADISGIQFGDILHIRSQDYAVRRINPDGTGLTLLELEAQ